MIAGTACSEEFGFARAIIEREHGVRFPVGEGIRVQFVYLAE